MNKNNSQAIQENIEEKETKVTNNQPEIIVFRYKRPIEEPPED